MASDWPLTILIAFPIWATLNYYLERRSHLVAYLGPTAALPDTGAAATPLASHSLILANTGRGEAIDIHIRHHTLPPFELLYPKKFSVSPTVNYSIEASEIVIPTLMPGHQITITYFYEPPLSSAQIHGEIRSKTGPAKVVESLPLASYPRWLTVLGVQLLELAVIAGAVYYFLGLAKSLLS